MSSLFQDLRYGLRVLRKAPGFTAVAVLTLALGIGANSAIFSLVNGILLQPLPYSHPEQLVSIKATYPKGAVVAMQEQVRSMDVAAYSEGHEFNLTGNGESVRLTGTQVSATLFSILGARPALGRLFYPGEDRSGQNNLVILSHTLWQQKFGGDRSIIGRSVRLEGTSRQVVGVMAQDFRFPSSKTQLWVPMPNDPRDEVSYWASDFMPVIGRLRQGTSLSQALSEIRIFQSRVGKLFPWRMPDSWNSDLNVVPLQSGMVADVRARLLLLLGAVALVLMIACANVANLLLSRSASRQREMTIRSALGAGRKRLTRQLLTESVFLATIGGLIGLGLARFGLALLKAALPAETPRLMEVHLDLRVLAFTGIVTVLTGVIFGLAPALQSSRAAASEALKAGGRGNAMSMSQGLRSSLAVAEVALAVLLVISAGLLIRSFWSLLHVNPGFQAGQLITARITPNPSFCSDVARCLGFYRDVIDQVQATPGVRSAALVNTLPLGGRVAKRSLNIENYEAPPAKTEPLFWLNVITPDYFRGMDIPLLAGRWFNRSDESGNFPVAVVPAATAQRYWPNQSALGKHIRFVGENNWRTVVGVVADVRAYDLQHALPDFMEGTLYVPFSPNSTMENGQVPAEMTIAVRTSLDEGQSAAMLRGIVSGLNPEAPVSEVRTMHAVISEAIAAPASTTSLFVTFAGLALVLGLIGIYGVLSFLVSRRTREIGIRMALGAQRSHVLWLVLKEGAKFSLTGIALGAIGALMVTRWLSSELYAVSAADPLTYAGVAVAMALVSLLACYVPAQRAMQVDPLIALRSE